MMSSSKRKAGGLNGGGPSTKKLTSAMATSTTSVTGLSDQLNGYPRKSSKSSNRREWMKECLKLLETMMDLDDSKPFREPVDCLKYPDFYAQVEDPIDFSKVMLKFRGGQYQDPFDFEKDVRQLFSDYKGFFKDPNSEVYAQTHRLCWWFESEFRRILEKYGDKLKKRPDAVSPIAANTESTSRTSPKQNTNIMVSINNGSCTILQSPERNSVPALLNHDHMVPVHPNPWHQSIASKNYQVVQQIMTPVSSSCVTPSNMHNPFAHSLANTHKDLYHALPAANPTPPWLDAHLRELRENALERPMYGAAEKRAGFSASRVINTSFEMNNSELQVPVTPNLYTRSLDRDPRLASPEHFRPHHPGLQQFKSASVDVYHHSPHEYDSGSHHSASLSPLARTQTPNTLQVPSPHPGLSPPRQSRCVHNQEHSPQRAALSAVKPTVTITTVKSPQDAGSVAMLVGMKLDVCNVWLGNVRGKAAKPIILHEHGLKIPFIYRDTETSLHIKVEEIVRCLAHVGKNKKHTILVFVTPSCVQRMERRIHVRDSNCSLIALFIPALTVANISRLLHTFHNMSKHSMFGASLFTEVDQKAILGMLANVKPDINEKMKDKLRISSNSSLLSVKVEHPGPLSRSSSMPVSSNPPVAASRSDQGALDLTVTRPNGMFHSASVDSPTTSMIKSKNTTKAYKPKFHFRTNNHLVRQNSTMVEPQFDSGMGSSSEESAPTSRPPLQKETSAESSGDSNESMTGSDFVKKEDLDAESDLDLDYDEEETVEGSSNSVLFVVDCNDEEVAVINGDEEEMEEDDRPFQSYPQDGLLREALPLESYRIAQQKMTYALRNPYCGHSYDRDAVLQLINEHGLKARCPMAGCCNDHPLRLTDMICGFEMSKTCDREPVNR